MKTLSLAVLVFLLAACAAQNLKKEQEQAIRDYIAVAELEETDRIRTDNRDSFELLDGRFLLYKTRRQNFLVEFRRICHEIRDPTVIVPDIRRDHNYIRARFDTLSGCVIDKIYALTEGQFAELEELGESPGDRN